MNQIPAAVSRSSIESDGLTARILLDTFGRTSLVKFENILWSKTRAIHRESQLSQQQDGLPSHSRKIKFEDHFHPLVFRLSITRGHFVFEMNRANSRRPQNGTG